MSELVSLGYVGIASRHLDDWSDFATGMLGMQLAERSAAGLSLRMDDRRQRVLVQPASTESCRLFGWEVADAAALERLASRLEAAGVAVAQGGRSLADQRLVRDLIVFQDPAGNTLEAFHGQFLADTPFTPGRNISGFRAGALGAGHIVLTTDRVETLLAFYGDILGFRLSDYTLRPFKAYFFHINARHHSFAVVETGSAGVHHLMVELYSLDDVGQAYDLAQADAERIGVTLGRHTNDFMTSFYARSPSGFMIEYGWGGRDIDPALWQPFECDYGPSLWGHDRSWLGPEKNAEARSLRLHAARAGYREPVQVVAGNYTAMAGQCPWFDAIKATASQG